MDEKYHGLSVYLHPRADGESNNNSTRTRTQGRALKRWSMAKHLKRLRLFFLAIAVNVSVFATDHEVFLALPCGAQRLKVDVGVVAYSTCLLSPDSYV